MVSKKTYFQDNGYIIFENTISHQKIDRLLDEFENFKDKNKLFYSQSLHNWRKAKLDIDKNGFLRNSVENFTDLMWANNLAELGRDILLSKEILEILQLIGRNEPYSMWQNMFFDKSTGTIDHLDSFYLDSYPNGHLIGVWIALEDMSEVNGTFHVYPRSHKIPKKKWDDLNHDEAKEYFSKMVVGLEKLPANLNKGDILLWHPFLIHGSSHQCKEGFSRKSLTAHYNPRSLNKGNGKVGFVSKNKDNYIFKNLPISTKSPFYSKMESFKGLFKYYLSFKNKINRDMRR